MKIRNLIGVVFLAAVLGTSVVHAVPDEIRSGTVTSAKTVDGYTYLSIQEAGREVWLAALPMSVKAGDVVEYAGGDEMKKFSSKAMNRTFESIRFVSRIHVVNKDMPRDDVHSNVNVGGEQVLLPRQGEIARAQGGKTVAEILGAKEALAGKAVLLRARVMKLRPNILGKNWVTLADGTGQAPNDRIVATTQESPGIGDVVTVTGVVKTNVNLGSGYEYAAIIEQAQFSAK
jgi:hypothetical protein